MATINTVIQTLVKRALILFIQIYRFTMSLMLGHCCRFEPTCSSYAIQAIQAYGSIKGSYLMIKRLLRCHPWHPGGHDPVSLSPINRSRPC